MMHHTHGSTCLLYTSDAADEEDSVDLRGGEELIELLKSALDREFKIWENQYYIELEQELVRENNLELVVDNEEDKA